MAFAEFVLKIRKYEERKESRLREPGENPGQLRCCKGKRNSKKTTGTQSPGKVEK